MLLSAEALQTLFHERYTTMVRLASWLLGEQAAGEDAVQDAFVRLGTVDLSRIDDPAAYLRTTVVNVCRTRLRHRSRFGFRNLELVPATTVPGADQFLVDEALVAAVAALPQRQRECVVLRYAEDLTIDQIATALAIGAGSVKTHLHRAHRSLAATLGARWEHER